jgi:hypothetical protein
MSGTTLIMYIVIPALILSGIVTFIIQTWKDK